MRRPTTKRIGVALSVPIILRRAIGRAVANDGLNLAQSAAYSAIVALFPALIVAAAAIALLPDVAPLRVDLGEFFAEVLPSDVLPLLRSYFASATGPGTTNPHTSRALLAAVLVSVSGASSTIVTLMQGIRRSTDLPGDLPDRWSFLRRRLYAIALVPLLLLPLGVATVLVMFGHVITVEIANDMLTSVRPAVYALALALRWSIALAGVTALTALLYHSGTARRQSWKRTVPGAIVATAMWFVTTLAFGWYVTRYANYSQVYGSLGAGIALLFWLYIVFFSVLCGAEFNQQFFARSGEQSGGAGVAAGRQPASPADHVRVE